MIEAQETSGESAPPEVPLDEEAPYDEGAPLAEALLPRAPLVEPLLPLAPPVEPPPPLAPLVGPLFVGPPSTEVPPRASPVRVGSSELSPSAFWRLNHSASASASEGRPPEAPLPAATSSR